MNKAVFYRMIPTFVRKKIRSIFFEYNLKKNIRYIHSENNKCIIFIAVPTHGNLGDQAIVYSQHKMFEKLGMSKQIIEITSEEYRRFSHIIEKLISNIDIIIIDGGGNMGTLWIEEEYKMRDIVNRFKNNKIIIFPQTVFYSEDDFGREEFIKSKCIYGNHNNLSICVRDKRSYDLIKNEYGLANIIYTPDIVLYINDINIVKTRKNAILCIREDREKLVDKEVIKRLNRIFTSKGMELIPNSTIVDKIINKHNREEELYKKWSEFSSAKIVITDRLHGMIFSAITGTPCIALNNCNGKVKGVYRWIENIPYIRFCDSLDKIEKDIEALCDLQGEKYNNKTLLNSFKQIEKIIDNK